MEYLDGLLFKTLKTLPAFPFALLVRPDPQSVRTSRNAFLSHQTPPTFTFTRALQFDSTAYLRHLDATIDRIETFPTEETIRGLYREKIEEFRTRCLVIQAIQKKDDEAVTSITDHLFGKPKLTTVMLQDEYTNILSKAHTLHTHEDRVNTTMFTSMIRIMLKHYGMGTWTIRETNRPTVSIIHGSEAKSPIIKIPKTLLVSRARAARLLTHEIEVHALRTQNGGMSPIRLLEQGLAGYIATDEGLAIAMQQTLRTEDSTEPGFWDAWAAALTIDHSFQDTFDILYAARTKLNIALHRKNPNESARDTAWNLLVRTSCGLHTPNKSGLGFRRGHLYRSGLLEIRQVFDTYEKDNILPTLFAGHAGTQHIPILKKLNITGKVPDMIAKDVVKSVLNAG